MELGNMMFGNSRGSHHVDRDMQDEWHELMEACGFDGYGHHEQSDEQGVFENAVFRVQPYYWGDCECDYEDREAAWSKANKHRAGCYQDELRGRLRVWEIENGYDAVRKRAYGDKDDFFGAFDVTTSEPMPGVIGSVMVPRTDDAMRALRALDSKRDKVRDGLYRELCGRHGLAYPGGCAVHCTCDYETRWAAFASENSHAPECRIGAPNFSHKPSGFTLEWYKYPLRDSYSSSPLTPELMRSMWADCAASVDTHPKGGDSTEIEAPAPLSGAAREAGDAQ